MLLTECYDWLASGAALRMWCNVTGTERQKILPYHPTTYTNI